MTKGCNKFYWSTWKNRVTFNNCYIFFLRSRPFLHWKNLTYYYSIDNYLSYHASINHIYLIYSLLTVSFKFVARVYNIWRWSQTLPLLYRDFIHKYWYIHQSIGKIFNTIETWVSSECSSAVFYPILRLKALLLNKFGSFPLP